MEKRFARVWDEIEHRAARGESLVHVLRGCSTDELVAALAVAGTRDAYAANLIATELLNRQRRAPYLGAFLVSVTMLVTIYALDYAYTRTPFILDTSPRAVILAAISIVIAVVSAVSYLAWRGSIRRPLDLILPRRGY